MSHQKKLWEVVSLVAFLFPFSVAAAIPGEHPCNLKQVSSLNQALPAYDSPSSYYKEEDDSICSKNLWSFIQKDQNLDSRWRRARLAGNSQKIAKKQKAVLKRADYLFYTVGLAVKKTLIAAEDLSCSNLQYLNSKEQIRACRGVKLEKGRGPQDYEVALLADQKKLDENISRIGLKAKLDVLDGDWARAVKKSVNQAQNSFALVTQKLKENDARKKEMLANIRINQKEAKLGLPTNDSHLTASMIASNQPRTSGVLALAAFAQRVPTSKSTRVTPPAPSAPKTKGLSVNSWFNMFGIQH